MATKSKPQRQYPPILALECATEFVEAAAGADGEKPKRPTFTMAAYDGNPMRVAAWMDPVVIDYRGLRFSDHVPIRRGHDPDRLIGHSTAIAVLDNKLRVEGIVSFETEHAAEVVASARNGFRWQASVGVAPRKVEHYEAGTSVEVNGRMVKGPIDVVRAGTLKEVSFVDLGAAGATNVAVAASATKGTAMDPDEIENNNGNPATATAAAPAGSPPPRAEREIQAGSAGEVIEAARRERERQSKITRMVAEAIARPGADLDQLERIAAEAIDQRWSITDTELAILRASRSSAPAVHVRNEGPPTNEVLAAAVLFAFGAKHDKVAADPDFGPRVAEAAWKRRGMGLHALIAAALKADGKAAPHGGADLYRAAVEHSIKAGGFSTVNLPGVLGTVGNKLLLDSFTAIEAIYPDITQPSDFQNFLTYTQYRLNDVGAFAEVAGDGELKHGSLAEESYTNRLATRGQMLTLTRPQIINDDLGALQQLYTILGRKARLAVERAVIDALLEGSDSFFSSAHANKQTSSALAIGTLASAEALMAAQLDADSEPVYAAPRLLVVPPGLKYVAQQIYTSAALVGGASAVPEDNPFRGRFEVKSSPYLALAALSGSSATTWYLLADPKMLPVIQVGYLQGNRAPTVETADAAFNTLGMQMRCFFDFGVAQVDYRGAVKSVA